MQTYILLGAPGSGKGTNAGPLCEGGNLYQRDDDTEDTIRNRLVVYEEKTAPLISFCNVRDKLARVTVTNEIPENTKKIRAAIAGIGACAV